MIISVSDALSSKRHPVHISDHSESPFHSVLIYVQARLPLLYITCLYVLLALHLTDYQKDGRSSWYLTLGNDGIITIYHLICYRLQYGCYKILPIRLIHGLM